MNNPTTPAPVAAPAQHTPELTMPCGFNRAGIPLKARLVHYRTCSHPCCIARLEAFESLKAEAAKPGALSLQRRETYDEAQARADKEDSSHE